MNAQPPTGDPAHSVAHRHHVVPQLFLRGFAAGRNLCVHHRDGTSASTTVKRAAVIPDFYGVDNAATADDELEAWLGRNIENPAAQTVKRLRQGHVPTNDELPAAAAFVAFQMVRGPSFRHRLAQLDGYLGPLMLGVDAISRLMREDTSFQPDDAEVQRLLEFAVANAPAAVRRTGPDADLRTMVREAARLKDLLQEMHWSICTSATGRLLVADTPVVVRDPVGLRDANVITLPKHFEVLMPLSPKRLLAVSPFPMLGGTTGPLSESYALAVNQATIRGCHDSVFHHPDMPWPQDLWLPRHSETIQPPRLTSGRANPDEPRTPPPSWPTLEPLFQQAIDLLGGNPEAPEPPVAPVPKVQSS